MPSLWSPPAFDPKLERTLPSTGHRNPSSVRGGGAIAAWLGGVGRMSPGAGSEGTGAAGAAGWTGASGAVVTSPAPCGTDATAVAATWPGSTRRWPTQIV